MDAGFSGAGAVDFDAELEQPPQLTARMTIVAMLNACFISSSGCPGLPKFRNIAVKGKCLVRIP
jgi:hypothetical protein